MSELKPAVCRVAQCFKGTLFLSAFFFLILFSSTAVRAEWTPHVATLSPSKGASGAITVNDRVVARLKLPMDGLPAADRLRNAASLIDQQLRLFPGKLTIEAARRTPGKESAVWLNGMQVLVASEADADEQGGSTLKLARHWASLLRSAASVSPLRFPIRQIVVPVGESRTLTVKGIARGPIQFSTTTASAFTASVAGEPNENDSAVQIRVTGRAPGTERLVVAREGATAGIDVIVRPWAGFISAVDPVILTGATIDSATRQDLARASVRNAIRLTPGALLRLPGAAESETANTKPLAVSSSTLTIPVEITGPNMLPRREDVSVRVRTSATPPAPTATTLLYSNDPEGITRHQVLYTARLGERSKGATRLLYHHQSRLSGSALFLVDLINDDTVPARLHLRGGQAGPVIDTVWVGYRAGDAFLQALSDGSGYFLDLPARTRLRIMTTRLPAGQTISGIQELVQTAGKPVQVRIAVVAASDDEKNTPLFTPEPVPTEPDGTGKVAVGAPVPSSATFLTPHLTLKNEYRVGERWDFVTIGHGHTNSVAANLIGAYGYMYDIEWNLINPTDKAALVRISFTPTAGLASGVFWINGQIVERVPQAREQQEIQIYRVQLQPGERRTVKLRTMPLAGSNYPARLVVHP